MRIDLNGSRALVTGGAQGIGLAAAFALHECGAAVTIVDRKPPDPPAFDFIPADVSDRAALARAFDRIESPDIVVANAGVAIPEKLENTTEEHWRHTVAVNLGGAFYTLQLAAERMKPKRKGSIVLTASTNSFDGEAGLIAYNASKAGLLGLLQTAANELGPYGIRVNAVCPGLIRTPLTQSHFGNEAVVRAYFRHIPLGRGGEPEEVAHAIAFLASPLASYITGATLLIDGGQLAGKFGTWGAENAHWAGGRWNLS